MRPVSKRHGKERRVASEARHTFCVACNVSALADMINTAVEEHKSDAYGSAGGSISGGGGSDTGGDLLSALLLMGGIVVVLLLAVVVKQRRYIPARQPPSPVAPPVTWHLDVEDASGLKRWSLTDSAPVTIGRSADSAVRLDDPQVSTTHALLRPVPGGWLLVNTESANGTFVDGRRIARAELHGGERVRVGNCTLVLHRRADIHP